MHAYVYGGAAILAVGMMVAGLLIGGRFMVVSVGDRAAVVIVDRFTGGAKVPAVLGVPGAARALGIKFKLERGKAWSPMMVSNVLKRLAAN